MVAIMVGSSLVAYRVIVSSGRHSLDRCGATVGPRWYRTVWAAFWLAASATLLVVVTNAPVWSYFAAGGCLIGSSWGLHRVRSLQGDKFAQTAWGQSERQAILTMPSESGPAWLPDPAGRHEYRYFDGAGWTSHVADWGDTASDPPPLV